MLMLVPPSAHFWLDSSVLKSLLDPEAGNLGVKPLPSKRIDRMPPMARHVDAQRQRSNSKSSSELDPDLLYLGPVACQTSQVSRSLFPAFPFHA